ncbi:MAG: hypothetical protein J5545_08785 [Bacteroidaceae bacterium]|nr:hypothetical protein [Bacteroidaceae bacterium]
MTKQNILSRAAVLLMMVFTMTVPTAWADWSGVGKGTVSEPYQITSYAQLKEFATIVNDGNTSACAILTTDIACTYNTDGDYDAPIGNGTKPYAGTFNGQGYAITHLRVSEVSGGIGFFGVIKGATVKNVILDFPKVSSTGTVVPTQLGALIGLGDSGDNTTNTVENCLVISPTLTINQSSNISLGAIIGTIYGTTTVTNCFYCASDTYKPIGNDNAGTRNNISRAYQITETQESMPSLKADDKVVFRRSFTKDVASTVCLPFGIDATQVAVDGKFYTFAGVDKTGEKWEVIMQEADPKANPPVAGNEASTLTANTPYLFMPAATGPVLFFGEAADVSSAGTTEDAEGWTFKGTYNKRVWDGKNNAAEIGHVYGFAAQSYAGGTYNVSPGDFVMAAEGASIEPFRAYLEYNSGGQSNGTKRRNTPAETGPLPTRMAVRLVGADGIVTGIGGLTPDPSPVGEGSWFTLDGRKLNSAPNACGLYIHHGQKVIKK